MLQKYLKFLTTPTSGKNALETHAVQQPSRAELAAAHAVDSRLSSDTVVGDSPGAEAASDGNEADAMQTLQRFLGRQPLLDGAYRIVGYELKLRHTGAASPWSNPETVQQMQDEMLLISVIDLDFQRALGNKQVFISLCEATFDNPLIEQLPTQKIVVGLTLSTGTNEHLLERCKRLKELGIPLALEDFEYRPEWEPFLQICRYVRMDTRRYDALALGDRIKEILSKASPQLIAKNVDTDDAFQAYRRLSFDFFEGYHFAEIQPGTPHRLDSSRARVMELLNLAMNHAELSAIEETVKLDPALSFKLLSYINSPVNGFQQKIRSIGHVLVLLGYDQLYRWLTLLLFTSGKPDARASALLKNALVRGRFTETLGKSSLPASEHGSLFIVGIFSLLDALLNIPMEQAVARLNLPDAVVEALIRREGVYGPYLKLAIACEDFDQDEIAKYAADCGVTADEVNIAHVNALIWGEEVDAGG
jgi:EAL and modified HD-GYP domain-containing signal transduction protein